MTPAERFWAKVDKTGGDCWLWTAGLYWDGYGQFWLKPTKVRAHRFSYELAKGPIPKGRVLDHLCRNRACVNPDHLEPVTNRQNLVRGTSLIGQCPSGHLYTEDTRINASGHRVCRVCHATRERRRRAENRETTP